MTPSSFLIYGKPGVFTFSSTPFSIPLQVVSRTTRACIIPAFHSSNSSTENSLRRALPIRASVAPGFRRAVCVRGGPAAFDICLEDSEWPQP
jgi:hypothetical protein